MRTEVEKFPAYSILCRVYCAERGVHTYPDGLVFRASGDPSNEVPKLGLVESRRSSFTGGDKTETREAGGIDAFYERVLAACPVLLDGPAFGDPWEDSSHDTFFLGL